MRNILFFASGLAILSLQAAPAFADDAAVERMFKAKCGACHGPDGKGHTKQGEKMKIADMTSGDWKKDHPLDKIKTTILDGVNREKDGVKQEMKPLRGKVTDDQIQALANFVRGLK